MTREEAKRTLEFFSVCSENHVTIAVNSRDRQAIDMAIKALQQPERKKGKWIDGFCSECHQEAITEWNNRGGEYALTRYCPNCGSYNGGEVRMIIRLLIKGDAIQIGEYEFYNPCRTVDVEISDNAIDAEHEHIIGVEIMEKK